MSHTPTPWKIDSQQIIGSESVHTNGRLRNSLGISSASYSEIVCEMHGSLELPAPQANAAFIVQAVNAHEALVGALQYITDDTEEYIRINHLGSGAFQNTALILARKALALAKGQP